MNTKNYYSANGKYLKEHADYFTAQQLKIDVDFLISALKFKKTDKILDLACGNGRHTIELKKRGYDIDGLDFSAHLLKQANIEAKKTNLKITFHKHDIHKINLKTKYNKIFLFFSEFGLFDANKVFQNVSKLLKKDGLFLLDYDNVFRLIKHLQDKPKSPYTFDFEKMELRGKDNNLKVKYYTIPELKNFFENNKFKIHQIYGNYKKEKLDKNSRRMIVIGKKI